jgi:hypothetical protein
MGRTEGSLWAASREEPGAGPFGGFSTIRWRIFAGARRADSRLDAHSHYAAQTRAAELGEENGFRR